MKFQVRCGNFEQAAYDNLQGAHFLLLSIRDHEYTPPAKGNEDITSAIESAIHSTKVDTISQPQNKAAGPPELKQGPNVTIQLGNTAMVEKLKLC